MCLNCGYTLRCLCGAEVYTGEVGVKAEVESQVFKERLEVEA